jgi:hypothetical protein
LASLYLNNHTIKTKHGIVGNIVNAWADEKRKYLP